MPHAHVVVVWTVWGATQGLVLSQGDCAHEPLDRGQDQHETQGHEHCLANDEAAPQALQRQAFLAWRRRWTRMLAVSCCRAFSSSLISVGSSFITMF